MRWHPDRRRDAEKRRLLPLWPALKRGFAGRCPSCGGPALFQGFLRVREACPDCAAPLGRARADDAPPYFTIMLTGHVVVPGMLILEQAAAPPLWVHAAIWLPLTLVMSLGLLRPIKGATVGALLSFGMLAVPPDPG